MCYIMTGIWQVVRGKMNVKASGNHRTNLAKGRNIIQNINYGTWDRLWGAFIDSELLLLDIEMHKNAHDVRCWKEG